LSGSSARIAGSSGASRRRTWHLPRLRAARFTLRMLPSGEKPLAVMDSPDCQVCRNRERRAPIDRVGVDAFGDRHGVSRQPALLLVEGVRHHGTAALIPQKPRCVIRLRVDVEQKRARLGIERRQVNRTLRTVVAAPEEQEPAAIGQKVADCVALRTQAEARAVPTETAVRAGAVQARAGGQRPLCFPTTSRKSAADNGLIRLSQGKLLTRPSRSVMLMVSWP
jgi:hypothetical protein